MTGGVAAPAWLERIWQAGRDDTLMRGWPKPVGGAKESAVLMLFGPTQAALADPSLLRRDDGAGVDLVLTERADTLRKHAGQVSFPGGGVEAQDADVIATALREAQEEIGLGPDGVDVFGAMAPVSLTVTNFTVHPVLAWWRRPSPVSALDPVEVARVVRVPVVDLADAVNRHTATHPRGFEGPAFEVDGLYVWGFTAFVLDALLGAGGVARPWDADDRRQIPQRFMH